MSSSQLAVERGLLYGESVHNSSLVVFDPFGPEQENANKVVFAKSGTGKSFACKVETLRALLLGVEYYVIDPEDEYGRICEAVGGQMVRLSAASPHHINPFDLQPGGEDGAARDPLAERGVLDQALYETYRGAGVTEDTATYDRPAPLLRDLLAALEQSDAPQGLAPRLGRYVTGSLGRVFSGSTTAKLDRPFVVFGARPRRRATPDRHLPDRRPRLGACQARSPAADAPDRRSLVADALPRGARFLAQLAGQARKRWLGLTTVTQDVEDFLRSPKGTPSSRRARYSSTIDLVAETFGLSAGERSFLLACRRGEGLFMARRNHIALRVEASPPEHALATTNPAELATGGTG